MANRVTEWVGAPWRTWIVSPAEAVLSVRGSAVARQPCEGLNMTENDQERAERHERERKEANERYERERIESHERHERERKAESDRFDEETKSRKDDASAE